MRRCCSIVAATLLAAALTLPETAEAQWGFLGLSGRTVQTLRAREPYLYACTSDGLFRRTLGLSDTSWTPIGLQGKYLNDVLPASAETLLAACHVSQPDPGDTISLHRTTNGGLTWEPFQNGFGGGSSTTHEARALAAVPSQPGVILGVPFGGRIQKSDDGGLSWRAVHLGCTWNFLELSPHSETAWAGGEGCIFNPVLVYSTNAGENWQHIPFGFGDDNACNAIAFHPTDPLVIFVGMERRVMRSTDGGASFQYVTSPNPSYIFGMGIGGGPPVRVYAAGSPLVVYRSEDLGVSWTSHIGPVTEGIDLWNLLLLRRDGSDTLYIGTSSGVFRFVDTPPVGVGPPRGDGARPALRGRPNPFRDRATLEFTLPGAGPARLRVLNVHGVEVARLLDGLGPAGPQHIEWDARGLPSGLYICELTTAQGSFARKLLRVR